MNSIIISSSHAFRGGLLAVLALAMTARLTALDLTPSCTEGPYYTFNSSQTLSVTALVGADNDLTLATGRTVRASGTRFLLSGTLVNASGTAISGATIELWEADNNGLYYHSGNAYQNRDQNFQGYGTCVTDSSGNWSFRTVRPGLYTGRIRHFHFKVRINGTEILTSQFMFEADRSSFASDNVASPLLSAGTIDRVLLVPTTGVDSVDNASAQLATKQIVVNVSGTSTSTSTGTTTTTATTTTSAGTSTSSAGSTSSGGGGGALSAWFIALLAATGALRLRKRFT